MPAHVSLHPRDFRDIAALLYRWTGIKLFGKEHLVEGRLGPKLRSLSLDYGAYLKRVEHAGPDSDDGRAFINALTTNKTAFFREAHHFEFLREAVIVPLQRQALEGGSKTLRLWSAGCSTGEEPYSLAVLAHHHLPAASGWDVKILATDIDTEVLAQGARAEYDSESIAAVPAELARNAFDQVDGVVRVRPAVAKLVQFSRANLVAERFPVKGRFHAILCRNVMIYFDRATQDRVVRGLGGCLRSGGYLIVGHSESLVAPQLRRVTTTPGVHVVSDATEPAVSPSSKPAQLPSAPVAARRPVAAPFVSEGVRQSTITVGEIAASAEHLQITTLLGSCVAACLWDPVAKIGGMNHFLLPTTTDDHKTPAIFGVHAMELLINRLMRLGAHRSRLVAKVFGAANVTSTRLPPIGDSNAAFVHEFLQHEGIPIVAERLGGTTARSISFDTQTGQVTIRQVSSADRVAAAEAAALSQPAKSARPFSVDDALF